MLSTTIEMAVIKTRRILPIHLDKANLILPWPCLYETLNTRFVKRPNWIKSFFAYTGRSGTVLFPDQSYRSDALEMVLRSPCPWKSLSLVDWVIRLAIEDRNTKIDAMITLNPKDFLDVCQSSGVELLSS